MSLDVYLTGGVDVGHVDGPRTLSLYEANYTHNITNMADAVGLYRVVWRPEENGIELARDLIPYLEKGIDSLESNPEYYGGFNPKNGWGSYDTFVPWLKRLLEACKEYPKAKYSTWR